MTESLERIDQEASRHDLRNLESRLLLEYYATLLNVPPTHKQADLTRFGSIARKLVSMWADLPQSARRALPTGTNTTLSLAARLMYYVAELQQEHEYKAHWYREASIAYAQGGNLPGCSTAWYCYQAFKQEEEPSDWLIDALLGSAEQYSDEVKALTPKAAMHPWLCADSKRERFASRRLYSLSCDPRHASVFEKSLVYRLSSAFPLFGELSLPKVLSDVGVRLPPWYRQSLKASRRMMLLPSQVEALKSWFQSETNMVLCTPTSTGKTFVSELACVIELAGSGGVAIFVTPYRAVARAIANVLETRLATGPIRVVRAYGDETIKAIDEPAIVVGTPEKLDRMITNDLTLLSKTRVVVFDEVHLISQKIRGSFYEGLIARVLLEQSLTSTPTRILAISAVVENSEALAKWFRTNVIATSRWRSNPIVESYWTNNDQLYIHDQSSPPSDRRFIVVSEFTPPFSAWPSRFVPPKGMQNALKKPLGERCSWYVNHWNSATNRPVLVICSSRAQTREFALICADESGVLDRVPLQEAAAWIKEQFPYLTLLSYCLLRGIAYHNAALPSRVRHMIEDMLNAHSLRAVFATTTLAEGADFPFRSVVISSPAHFDPETESYTAMSPLLLRNIAGRGGRTVGHLIGDVVQMYSPLEIASSTGKKVASDDIFNQYLLDPTECQVHSAFADQMRSAGSNGDVAVAFSAFDRVIHRWSDQEDAISLYRKHFFDRSVSQAPGRQLELRYERVMREGEEFGVALALRASPLHLTELGEVVLMSGFAVLSAGVIWKAVKMAGWFETVPTPRDIVRKCSELGGRIPEVTELKTSNRRPLSDANIADVFEVLQAGGDLTDAYLRAEASASGATQKRAELLVVGKAKNDDSVHGRFEAFCDDVKRKLLIEIPSVAKAMRAFVVYEAEDYDTTSFDVVIDVTSKIKEVID